MKGKVDYTKVPGYLPEGQRRCRWCNEVMKPVVAWIDLADDAEGENVVKRFNRKCRPVQIRYYGYGPEGYFCTLKCGYLFGCHRIETFDHDQDK